MSLQEDINGVKQEIDNEEKFLSAFVKTEKFVKKYKILVVSLVSVAVLGGIGYKAYGYYEEHRIIGANEAYSKLMKNPNDKDALAALKAKSSHLYDAFVFQSSLKDGNKAGLDGATLSKNRVIADMATYESALASANIDKLSAYGSNKESIYKDLALFVVANKHIEKGDYKKARETLNKIPATSELKEYASYLFHSIVTLN